jgi:predicted Zn-dependent protease
MTIAKEGTMAHADTLIRNDRAGGLLLEGLVELSRGNDEAALEAFVALLAGSERSTLATLCAARLLMKRREMAGAAAILEDLAAREPALAEARYLLGQAYRGTYRTIEAIRSYRAALDLDPAHEGARSALEQLAGAEEP